MPVAASRLARLQAHHKRTAPEVVSLFQESSVKQPPAPSREALRRTFLAGDVNRPSALSLPGFLSEPSTQCAPLQAGLTGRAR